MEDVQKDSKLSLHAEAIALIQGLLKPNPIIYWIDFTFFTVLGWFAFVMAVIENLNHTIALAWFIVSALCLYRSVIFIHEIAHFKAGSFRVFRLFWNLFSGFPLLLPSFSYSTVHLNHHRRNAYGTAKDGEYLPFVKEGFLYSVGYLLLSFPIPIALVFRSLILSPLGWFIPSIGKWNWIHTTSLAIDLAYERPEPKPEELKSARLQEVATFIYWVTFLTLIVSGIVPLKALILWYAMSVTVLFLNSVRTLAAHRYANSSGRSLSIEEQFIDSIDILGNPYLTPLWAPVGLRYHATHHLFPAIPYHNLGKARRCLEKGLVQNANTYNKTACPSLMTAIKNLLEAQARERLSPALSKAES